MNIKVIEILLLIPFFMHDENDLTFAGLSVPAGDKPISFTEAIELLRCTEGVYEQSNVSILFINFHCCAKYTDL